LTPPDHDLIDSASAQADSLPRSVDSTRISAKYSDGVLDIHLPKSEEAKPKKIEIATA
jgi:HSP20 family protein